MPIKVTKIRLDVLAFDLGLWPGSCGHHAQNDGVESLGSRPLAFGRSLALLRTNLRPLSSLSYTTQSVCLGMPNNALCLSVAQGRQSVPSETRIRV